MDITQDVVTGRNQTGENLWDRIESRYNQIRLDGAPKRDAEVRYHWTRVTKEVTLFKVYYLEAKRILGSGKSERDLLLEFKNFTRNCSDISRLGKRYPLLLSL